MAKARKPSVAIARRSAIRDFTVVLEKLEPTPQSLDHFLTNVIMDRVSFGRWQNANLLAFWRMLLENVADEDVHTIALHTRQERASLEIAEGDEDFDDLKLVRHMLQLGPLG